jgi:CheY-like chemotaxis protein
MKGDAERCRIAGMDGYLPKPIHPPDLYAMVDGCTPTAGTESDPGNGASGNGASPSRQASSAGTTLPYSSAVS